MLRRDSCAQVQGGRAHQRAMELEPVITELKAQGLSRERGMPVRGFPLEVNSNS